MKNADIEPIRERSSWSLGTLEQLNICPCCGNTEPPARTYRRQDSFSIMPDLWSICLCKNCGSLYLDPRPDRESLPQAYAAGHPSTQTEHVPEQVFVKKGILWALARDYLHWRFDMVTSLPTLHGGRWLFRALIPLRRQLDRFGRHLDLKRLPAKGKLLDVGCGNGTFLLLAKSMGWQAEGLEPDPKAAAICRAHGIEVIASELPQLGTEQNATYDVITMNHVIEHVFDPQEVFAKCFQLLRPGGMLWIALPNPQSFDLKYFRKSWQALQPPFHLQMPTQDQLKIWLADAGLDRIEFVRNGYHSKKNLVRQHAHCQTRQDTAASNSNPALMLVIRVCRVCYDITVVRGNDSYCVSPTHTGKQMSRYLRQSL